MAVDIFLIRHPEPAIARGICYGRSDVALAADETTWLPDWLIRLDNLGFVCDDAQATGLAQRPQIYSSPLQRCAQAAHALVRAYGGAPPKLDASLQEMDFGSWELQTWENIGRAALDYWAENLETACEHGGESVQALRARVTCWTPAGSGPFAVITHAGVMRILTAHWLGCPLHDVLAWPIAYGGICQFRLPILGRELKFDPGSSSAAIVHWNA